MGQLEDTLQQIDDLNATSDTLQTTVTATQEKINTLLKANAEVVGELNVHLLTLQSQVQSGIAPADVQKIRDALTRVSAKLVTTIADVATTGNTPAVIDAPAEVIAPVINTPPVAPEPVPASTTDVPAPQVDATVPAPTAG